MHPSSRYSWKTADRHQTDKNHLNRPAHDRPDNNLRRSSQPGGLRPIDILASLDQTPTSSSNPVNRPIDVLASMDYKNSSQQSVRPIDILALLEQEPSSSAVPLQIPSGMRPIDLLNLLSHGSAQPDPCHHENMSRSYRPIAPLPKRALPSPIGNPTPKVAAVGSQTHYDKASYRRPKSQGIHKPKPVTSQADSDDSTFLDLTTDTPSKPVASQTNNSTFLDLTTGTPSKPVASKADHSTFLDLTTETPPKPVAPQADGTTLLDLTADSPIRRVSADILEISGSSEGYDNPEVDAMEVDMGEEIVNLDVIRSRGKYIFNTNDPVDTRHTSLPWMGSLRPEDWIPSREELHADQVDYDRSLPSEMIKAGHPLFAISPADMESMHRFLMARYQVSDFGDYKRLLALLRNTRAIEAQKARERHADLLALQTTVEAARHRLHAL